jgi:hypothetical protein
MGERVEEVRPPAPEFTLMFPRFYITSAEKVRAHHHHHAMGLVVTMPSPPPTYPPTHPTHPLLHPGTSSPLRVHAGVLGLHARCAAGSWLQGQVVRKRLPWECSLGGIRSKSPLLRQVFV